MYLYIMLRDMILNDNPDQDIVFADGFDDCILGLDESTLRVIYSANRCVAKILAYKGINSYAEAEEFFYTDVYNRYAEEWSPIFIVEYSYDADINNIYLN